jgi:hypothetical protein
MSHPSQGSLPANTLATSLYTTSWTKLSLRHLLAVLTLISGYILHRYASRPHLTIRFMYLEITRLR